MLHSISLAVALLVAADKPQPVLYELVINGESFTVEADKSIKLHSKKKPGVTYEVALRVAQVQRLALNRVQLDYDRGYEVSDGGGDGVRTASLTHELGYTIALTDVGGELDAAARAQVLESLKSSMEKSIREGKAEGLKVTSEHERKFQHAGARGVTLQYHDAKGRAHSCLVYVLAGKGFTASAIVQFQDADHADVLPLIKTTLDSVQARSR